MGMIKSEQHMKTKETKYRLFQISPRKNFRILWDAEQNQSNFHSDILFIYRAGSHRNCRISQKILFSGHCSVCVYIYIPMLIYTQMHFYITFSSHYTHRHQSCTELHTGSPSTCNGGLPELCSFQNWGQFVSPWGILTFTCFVRCYVDWWRWIPIIMNCHGTL